MMRAPGIVPCAIASADAAEPLLGTASRVRRWLVIEQPGPWGVEALTESRLDPGVAQALAASTRAHGVRPVLIRRWGESATGARRVYLARVSPAGGWIRQLDLDADGDLVDVDLGVLASAAPPALGVAGPPAVHLVCTNGRHDACCADLGRPVVRALRESGTPEVWESSHLGGDRFAANIASLPSGVFLGRVLPEEAAGLLRDLEAGLVDLDHYRGRSCYPPLVQAAEIFARRALDERRIDALRAVSSTSPAPDVRAVLLHRGEDRVEVVVRRERGPATHLTCAGGRGEPWRYVLVELRAAPPGAPQSGDGDR
jgi:hypothetical protein